MGEERRSSPSVCLHDFFAQKFDGVLFNARYIGARNPEHGSDLVPVSYTHLTLPTRWSV